MKTSRRSTEREAVRGEDLRLKPPHTLTSRKCHGGRVGFFSLNGIFKASCFAGLITVNHSWGAERGFAESHGFSKKQRFSPSAALDRMVGG